MIRRLRYIVTHPLFSGSAIMIVGSNISNFLSYLYHLIMGRLLGPASYGELATLFSLIGILGIFSAAFNLVVVKYVSASSTKESIGGLVEWLNKKVIILTIIISGTLIIASPFITSFLNLSHLLPVILIAAVFPLMMLIVLNRAVLQGLLHFNQTVVILLAENGARLVFGVLMVYLGFLVNGALLGLLVGIFLVWILSERFIRDYRRMKTKELPQITGIFRYSFPVLVQSAAVTSLYSSDLVLVKHFFPSFEAGLYAALSTLGKVIFFAAGPISSVMFPIVSKRYAQGGRPEKVFLFSLLGTFVIALGVLVIYGFFPAVAINVLFGSSYLQATNLLFLFGLFISLLTLSFTIINFHLSLRQTKVVLFPLLAALGQIVGIWSFHNSLFSVIMVSVIVSGFLLISLLLYTFIKPKK